MFNKIISKKSNLYFLSLSSLIILSGCWGKKAKDQEALVVDPADTSVVLLKVNGTPKVTVNSLEADINEISEMDQQLKLMMMFNPEDTRERVFQEKKRMAVIEAWALKNGVRNNPQYQAKRAKIMQHVDMQLDFEQFLTSHKVDVTPEEVLAYYEENKTQDPRILISQAGVKTQAVEFSDQKVANVFYKELKKAGADQLEELAKAQKYFVRDMNLSFYAE